MSIHINTHSNKVYILTIYTLKLYYISNKDILIKIINYKYTTSVLAMAVGCTDFVSTLDGADFVDEDISYIWGICGHDH